MAEQSASLKARILPGTSAAYLSLNKH